MLQGGIGIQGVGKWGVVAGMAETGKRGECFSMHMAIAEVLEDDICCVFRACSLGVDCCGVTCVPAVMKPFVVFVFCIDLSHKSRSVRSTRYQQRLYKKHVKQSSQKGIWRARTLN